MASYTPNYNLYKPAGTDQFDNFLTEFGNNMDTIDSNLGGGGGSSTLAGLSDVNLTSPTTDDALIYDGAEWVNSPLSAVAFSGDYSDLSNAPTIPTKTSDLNNDSGFLDSSDITVTQVQTTGTKIATIDVDGNSTDLYAPTGGGSSYTEGDGIDITSNTISVDTTFTEASTRANINSGDTFSTILGKIKKWFTDIPSLFVSKTGDTMTGALTINESSAIQATFSRSHSDTTSKLSLVELGNNIAEGTAGSAYGALRFYGTSSKYVDLIGLPTSNQSINFPDESGTIALIPRHTKLFDNIYISTADQWLGLMNPTINFNDYDYLGFSFCEADNSYDQSKIQVLIKVSDFKNTTQSRPLIVVDYPWNGGNEWKLRVAYGDIDGFDVYRGNQVYQYKRLVCIGIKC